MLNSNKAQKHLLMFLTLLICFTFSTTSSVYNKAIGEEQAIKNTETAQSKDAQSSDKMLMDAINAIKQQLNQLESRVSSLESKVDRINVDNENKTKPTSAQKWIDFASSTSQNTEITKQANKPEHESVQPIEDKKEISNVQSKAEIEENKVKEVEENTQTIEQANPNEKIESTCPIASQEAGANNAELTLGNGFRFNISTEKLFENSRELGKVSIAGKAVIIFRNSLAGKTPYERANITAKKLESLLASGFDISKVTPVEKNGLYIVLFNNESIFTIDKDAAKNANTNQADLALSWINNIRTAMGMPKVSSLNIEINNNTEHQKYKNNYKNYRKKRFNYKKSDSKTIEQPIKQASRSFDRSFYDLDSDSDSDNDVDNNIQDSKPSEPLFKQHSVGGASWYGPGFDGRRTSNGSRFNQNDLTAAHKTLPFGTMVKVTNLNNNKSCIVKITDRGPFIAGRIIDLSKGAAAKVGMLGSGIAKVKLEILNK